MAFDLVETGLVNQRANVDAVFHAIANGHLVDPLSQFLAKLLRHLFVHENPVGTHTGLATTTEFVGDQVVGGSVQVGVVEYDERCITAQLQRQFFHLLRRIENQPAAHFGGTGKAEHRHIFVLAQHLADHAGLAHDQIDHAIRQPELVHHADEGHHRQRRFTGRLDHRRAAGRQGSRELFGNHANGKIPGHDQAGHTNRPVMNSPGAILGLLRDGMGIQGVDVFGAVIEETRSVVHFALGFLQRLAVLHAQDSANFLAMFFQTIANVFQPLAPGLDGPGVGEPERRLACLNGIQHILL